LTPLFTPTEMASELKISGKHPDDGSYFQLFLITASRMLAAIPAIMMIAIMGTESINRKRTPLGYFVTLFGLEAVRKFSAIPYAKFSDCLSGS
jgi:hypothetical protein